MSDLHICRDSCLFNLDYRRMWTDDSYLQRALDILASEYEPYVSPEIKAKQKRIERLLLILALVRIKRYLEPPAETGTPLTVILEFPSPPEDSERIPGIVRKISAVVLGAAFSISFIFKVEIEVLVLIEAFGLEFPVITTSSILFDVVTVSAGDV